jgi:acyl carrier protein
MQEALLTELKEKIIDTLNLIDVTPADITVDDPLVGGKLGIDSIDVLELVMMIEKEYAVKIDNKEVGAEVFANLRSMARYIGNHAPAFRN